MVTVRNHLPRHAKPLHLSHEFYTWHSYDSANKVTISVNNTNRLLLSVRQKQNFRIGSCFDGVLNWRTDSQGHNEPESDIFFLSAGVRSSLILTAFNGLKLTQLQCVVLIHYTKPMKVQGCGMSNRGIVVRFLTGEANFSALLSIRTSSWAHLAFYSTGAWGALSTGVKWSGSKPDNSLPCSAEVKNEWRYTPTPPICHHGRHR